MSICVVAMMEKGASFLSVELFCCQLGLCCAVRLLFYFTAFYLNLHIYLYKSIWLSRLSEFHFIRGEN